MFNLSGEVIYCEYHEISPSRDPLFDTETRDDTVSHLCLLGPYISFCLFQFEGKKPFQCLPRALLSGTERQYYFLIGFRPLLMKIIQNNNSAIRRDMPYLQFVNL